MLKKILIGLAVASMLAVVAAMVGGYLLLKAATAEPEFYAEAVESPASEEEAAQFEATAARLARLIDAESGDGPESTGEGGPTAEVEDGAVESEPADAAADDAAGEVPNGPQTLVVEQAALNAWLALNAESVSRSLGPGLTDPRVVFDSGRAKIGVRINGDGFRGVLTGEVRPVVVSPDELELRFVGFRVGTIEFPVNQLRGQSDNGDLPDGVTIDVSEPPPRLRVRWDELDGAAARVLAAEVGQGALTLTLEPIEPPDAADEADPETAEPPAADPPPPADG